MNEQTQTETALGPISPDVKLVKDSPESQAIIDADPSAPATVVGESRPALPEPEKQEKQEKKGFLDALSGIFGGKKEKNETDQASNALGLPPAKEGYTHVAIKTPAGEPTKTVQEPIKELHPNTRDATDDGKEPLNSSDIDLFEDDPSIEPPFTPKEGAIISNTDDLLKPDQPTSSENDANIPPAPETTLPQGGTRFEPLSPDYKIVQEPPESHDSDSANTSLDTILKGNPEIYNKDTQPIVVPEPPTEPAATLESLPPTQNPVSEWTPIPITPQTSPVVESTSPEIKPQTTQDELA